MGFKLGGYWLAVPSDSALFPVPTFFLRQGKFWVKTFVTRLVSLWLHWGSCLATASSGSISLMLWVTVKDTFIDFWAPPLFQVSVLPSRCPHTPTQLQVYSFSCHLAIPAVPPHTWSWPLSSVPSPVLLKSRVFIIKCSLRRLVISEQPVALMIWETTSQNTPWLCVVREQTSLLGKQRILTSGRTWTAKCQLEFYFTLPCTSYWLIGNYKARHI